MDGAYDAAEAALQAGRIDEGVQQLVAALSADGAGAPVEAFRRLVTVLITSGRIDPAHHWCSEGLRLHETDFDLWNMKGVALRRMGKLPQAVAALDAALALRPDNGSAQFNKVNVYNEMGLGAEALPIALRLVEKNPTSADCHRVAGVACRNLKAWDEAAAHFDAALALDPRSLATWIDRIGLATELQRHDQALALLDRALGALPEAPSLLEARAQLLRRAGREGEARRFLEAVLARQDATAWAHNQLGRILGDEDRPLANEHLRRAVALEPQHFAYRAALMQSLLRSTYGPAGSSIQEAYEVLVAGRALGPIPSANTAAARNIYQRMADFDAAAAMGGFSALGRSWASANNHGAFLSHLGRVVSPQDRRELVEQHRDWGRRAQAQAEQSPIVHPPARAADGRIRLGLMSSDLCNHPVGYFVLPLFEHLDERFELYGYSFNRRPEDPIQRYLASRAKAFRVHPFISDRDAAQMIADDQLDMLIELGGSTHMNKLEVMAYRPARLQASWLGYPHSAGLEAIDHIVLDPHLVPPDPALLIERPLVMPRTWLSLGGGQFTDDLAIDPVPPEARTGVLTFGTANQPSKYGPEVIRTWARVLKAVPGSRFLFLRPEAGAEGFRENIAKAFAQAGVAPERIAFAPVWGQHLPFYNQIDISLDTFPLTGGTTTCESLWMGVPVVSLAGEALFERLSYSLLSNAGLGDLCAESIDGYVDIAMRLADDRLRREALRTGLRDQLKASPLGQTEQFARDFYDLVAATVAADG